MGITSSKALLESQWNWLLGVPKGAFAPAYSIPKIKLGNQINSPPLLEPSSTVYFSSRPPLSSKAKPE